MKKRNSIKMILSCALASAFLSLGFTALAESIEPSNISDQADLVDSPDLGGSLPCQWGND